MVVDDCVLPDDMPNEIKQRLKLDYVNYGECFYKTVIDNETEEKHYERIDPTKVSFQDTIMNVKKPIDRNRIIP